ncbi:MAG TPA: tetratricopeptide repeat protein [Pyrinomonadaceae bacterium]|nr:tetratricopeptide repeat protein [Pyrinomonadaceae bacterium]
MKRSTVNAYRILVLTLLLAIFLSPNSTYGQQLVSVSDITGSSSVFVFRTSAKASPRQYVSRVRTPRTQAQRTETARRFNRQYVTLAKVAPRRQRTDVVNPNDPRLPKVRTMPASEAARLFAGVGEYYMDRDDFDRAVDFFREAVQLDGKYQVARNGLSEALALKGNEELVRDARPTARRIFEEALTYNPNNAPAHFGLGEVFAADEKDPEARVSYERALNNDKELTEIYVPLGILYFKVGEIAKADDLLSKAMAIDPNDGETQYFLGLIRYSQNRNAEALTAFRKAIAADAANAEAYYHAGETLTRLNRHSEAQADFQKARDLRPAYFEAWLGLGSAHYEQGNWAEAVKAYEQAVKLRNNNAEAYENLADAYRQIPNFEKAEANYKLAALFIERTPDFNKEQAADIYSKSAYMVAKQCEINRARNMRCRWGDAVTYLEKANQFSGSGLDTANLGWAYYNSAREDLSFRDEAAARPKLEKARAALQTAASGSNKYSAGPLVNLGRVLADMGDDQAAIDAFNRALKLEPDWAFAMNELGSVYRKQNKFKEAAAQFRRAASKEEKNPVIQFNLAEAEFQSGNLGEAKKAYDRLKKMGPSAVEFTQRLERISGGRIRG